MESEIRALLGEESWRFGDGAAALVEYTTAITNMVVTNEVYNALSEHYPDENPVGIGLLIMNSIALAHGVDGFGVEVKHDEFVGRDRKNT
ncbi:hypothetical protein ACFQO4_18635 [Saliphagus sp. GCM10025334]